MRLVRVLAPAIVAALLWWASGGLQLFGRQHYSGIVSHYFDFIAPQTVSVEDIVSPAPWGLVMTVLSMLALAGAYAALLGLVRRRAGTTSLATFAAYWLCAVLAGSVVALVPVIAEIVAALADGRPPFGLAVDLFSDASYWGLPWGWIPAVVAVLLDRGVGSNWTAVGRRIIVIPAAALFLLAAIGLGVAEPYADDARQGAIPDEPLLDGMPAPGNTPGMVTR